MKIVSKGLWKLQIVNKLSNNSNIKGKIKTNVHFDNTFKVSGQKG